MAIALIGSALSLAGSLFGGGDPRDANRNKTSDGLYAQALNGNVSAEMQLRCLAGVGDARGIPYGFDPAKCGWATSTAKAYARGLVTKLDAARFVSGASGPTPALVPSGGAPPAAPNAWMNWAFPAAVVGLIVFALPALSKLDRK